MRVQISPSLSVLLEEGLSHMDDRALALPLLLETTGCATASNTSQLPPADGQSAVGRPSHRRRGRR